MYFSDLPRVDKIIFVVGFLCIALTGLILGLAVAMGVN